MQARRVLKLTRMGSCRTATEDTSATLSPITPSLYCFLLPAYRVITALGVVGAPGDVGVIPDRACAICTIGASFSRGSS
jgi:hypothetical protein